MVHKQSMSQGTFSDYHLIFNPPRVVSWMFYGGDFPLDGPSEHGIFIDYVRNFDADATDSTFGSRLSKN